MDRGQLQAFSKATLLGLVLLSVVTLVPHGFSCLRGFLFASLPSAASAIVTRKQWLFVFSNVIVVFLARESKLLKNGTAQSPSGEYDEMDVVVRELAVFAPSIKENDAAAEDIVRAEQAVDAEAVRMSPQQQLDQCAKEDAQDEVPLEDVMKEEDCEEEATELPTVDELNRRVEDFIARFNMERQLEEWMVVCC